MTLLLLTLFTYSLFQISGTYRVKQYIISLRIQGYLLFLLVYFTLSIHLDIITLIFIILETLFVKGFLIPFFLEKIRKHNKIKYSTPDPKLPHFSIFFMFVALGVSFWVSSFLFTNVVKIVFFTTSLTAIFAGLYYIIAHRKILSHLIGYLVMENGIFLLSLAVGAEMPLIVNLAILLDLLIGILVLGIFINTIEKTCHSSLIDDLSQIKEL